MLRSAVLMVSVALAASLNAEPADSSAQTGTAVQVASLGDGALAEPARSHVLRAADSVRVELVPEHPRRHARQDRRDTRDALSGVILSALSLMALGLLAIH
jgi:hypothetical protein